MRLSPFPTRVDCPKCLSNEVKWTEVSGKGSLITHTVVHYGTTGFENDVPYAIGIAEFQGLQVFGRLSKNIKENEIKPGMPLKIVPINLNDGRVSYEFRKYDSGNNA